MIRQVKVGILGQEYTIHTKADREYVEKVVDHLASRCQEAESSLRSSSQATIALLAAMNITSDYLQLKKAHRKHRRNDHHQQQGSKKSFIDRFHHLPLSLLSGFLPGGRIFSFPQ